MDLVVESMSSKNTQTPSNAALQDHNSSGPTAATLWGILDSEVLEDEPVAAKLFSDSDSVASSLKSVSSSTELTAATLWGILRSDISDYDATAATLGGILRAEVPETSLETTTKQLYADGLCPSSTKDSSIADFGIHPSTSADGPWVLGTAASSPELASSSGSTCVNTPRRIISPLGLSTSMDNRANAAMKVVLNKLEGKSGNYVNIGSDTKGANKVGDVNKDHRQELEQLDHHFEVLSGLIKEKDKEIQRLNEESAVKDRNLDMLRCDLQAVQKTLGYAVDSKNNLVKVLANKEIEIKCLREAVQDKQKEFETVLVNKKQGGHYPDQKGMLQGPEAAIECDKERTELSVERDHDRLEYWSNAQDSMVQSEEEAPHSELDEPTDRLPAGAVQYGHELRLSKPKAILSSDLSPSSELADSHCEKTGVAAEREEIGVDKKIEESCEDVASDYDTDEGASSTALTAAADTNVSVNHGPVAPTEGGSSETSKNPGTYDTEATALTTSSVLDPALVDIASIGEDGGRHVIASQASGASITPDHTADVDEISQEQAFPVPSLDVFNFEGTPANALPHDPQSNDGLPISSQPSSPVGRAEPQPERKERMNRAERRAAAIGAKTKAVEQEKTVAVAEKETTGLSRQQRREKLRALLKASRV